ncbi:MAG: hypothetical protein IJH25_18190 [Clostridia bacterium]|nr:hypothetical protein [Clostridia bacterium]MBQ6120196.1 hypothetical protein [Clostridia bacterium]
MARSFSDVAGAEEVLEDIKNNKYSSVVAYGLLNQIINDFPGTWVAQQAQQLKDERF